MNNFLFELIGTAFLILLGNGVVANVVLNKTKGNNGGWIVITFGWVMAVFVGVYVAAAKSGAHLNPAVTIALAAADKFEWALVPVQIAGQFAGAARAGRMRLLQGGRRQAADGLLRAGGEAVGHAGHS